jgi:hypothetical protein
MPLHLCSLTGRTHEMPYLPDMPRWQYLAEVVARTGGFAVVDGTVFEHVISRGELWTYRNKFDRIGDVLEDGERVCFVLPIGRFDAAVFGNACAQRGDASACAVCFEPSFDMAFDCLHFFHADCVRRIEGCPTCGSMGVKLRNGWGMQPLSARLPSSAGYP